MDSLACGKAEEKNEVLPVLRFHTSSSSAAGKSETTSSEECHTTVTCLKCPTVYEFPEGKDDYLAHLFLEHRLVIADVDDIALLEQYLIYWQTEFQQHEFEEYCTTMLLDQLPDGRPSKNEKYYLLSDILPKDYELRTKLRQQHLEKILRQHQWELTDREFTRECLHCRDVISGLRSDYLEHLFRKHFLQLGKPSNLVFIDELLDRVKYNMDHLICLYCEKVFRDRSTLKDHMRKKAHKRINPNNKAYDKYFLENYRIPDEQIQRARKRTKQYKKARSKSATRGGKDSNSRQDDTESVDLKHFAVANRSSSDSDWLDWNGEDNQPLICLFCTEESSDLTNLKQHINDQHNFDLNAAISGLTFYQRIKIVNYVRRQMCLDRCVTCNQRFDARNELEQHLATESHYGIGSKEQWDKPEYFFPTYEDDGLLYVLDDDNTNDMDDIHVPIISEDSIARINKEAERLSLENFELP